MTTNSQDKPVIVLDPLHTDIAANQCIALLKKQNQCFLVNGEPPQLVEIRKDYTGVIKLNVVGLQYILDGLMTFEIPSGEQKNPVSCPAWLARMVLSPTINQSLNVLQGLTVVPILHKDFSVFCTPGYDFLTRYYFYNKDAHQFNENPSDDDLKQALTTVFEPFKFYEMDALSRANLLCSLLSIITLPLLTTCPLFFITSARPGIGKTLLAKTLQFLAEARENVLRFPNTNVQLDKQISRISVQGHLTVILDNLKKNQLNLSGLSTMTSGYLNTPQVVGAYKTIFLMTGLDTVLSDDLARQVLKIKIDSHHPIAEKTDFCFSSLDYVKEHRVQIISALFTLFFGYKNAALSVVNFDEYYLRQLILWLGEKVKSLSLDQYLLGDPMYSFDSNREEIEDLSEAKDLLMTLYHVYMHEDFTSNNINNDRDIKNKFSQSFFDSTKDSRQELNASLVNCLSQQVNAHKIGKYLIASLLNRPYEIVGRFEDREFIKLTTSKKRQNKWFFKIVNVFPDEKPQVTHDFSTADLVEKTNATPERADLLTQIFGDDQAGKKPVTEKAEDFLPETMSYDQLIFLVINQLGQENCAQLRSALWITDSLSSSYLLFSIFKAMGLVERRKNCDESLQSEISDFTLSNQAKPFYVANAPIFDFGEVSLNGHNLESYTVEIQWKSTILDEILHYAVSKIGNIKTFCVGIPVVADLLQRNQLTQISLKEMQADDLEKLCWSRGFDADESGTHAMMNDLVAETLESCFQDGKHPNLTEKTHQFGAESFSLRVLIHWRPEILKLLCSLIEEKTALTIDCASKEALLDYQDKKLLNFGDIAKLLKNNLSDNLIRSLRTASYEKEDSYKYIPNCLVCQLICELGFYSSEINEFAYLTETGKEFAVWETYVTLDFLGWKPTIIPLIFDYIENNLQKYDGEKGGDFISSMKISEAIDSKAVTRLNKELSVSTSVWKKRIGYYKHRFLSVINSMEESGKFSEFLSKKRGPNRWKSEIISTSTNIEKVFDHVVEYTASLLGN